MKKFLIIYHQEDNDGVLSAAIFKYYLLYNLKIGPKDVELLPATYNTLKTIVEKKEYEKWKENYAHIIMTDISFNDSSIMLWLKKNYKENFTWVDHHAPIIKESIAKDFDDINGIRRTDHSAIYNAWLYLYDPFGEKEIPEVIKMLSAWDSWTYEDEGIDPEYCRAYNKGFTITSQLKVGWWMNNMELIIHDSADNAAFISSIYESGKKECDRQDSADIEMIRVNGDPTWKVNDIPAIMVVTTGQTNSFMFRSLQVENPTEENIRVAAVFKHCKDGNWTLSLYNIYDYKGKKDNPLYFHCGEYLHDKYNGGGHEGAAGCTIGIDKLYLMLKSKKI
jgi:oligoribonuclease NrnB/cAMP/cGMP phosphodiesterase (DHH superfamily)